MASYLGLLLFVFCQNVKILEFHLLVISAQVFSPPFCFFILAKALDKNLVVKLHLLNLFIQMCFRLRLGKFFLKLISSFLTLSKHLLKLAYLSILFRQLMCGNEVYLALTVCSVDHKCACVAYLTGPDRHPERLAARHIQ